MSGKSPPSKSPVTRTANSTPRQKSGSTTRGKSPQIVQQQTQDRVKSAKSRQSQSPKTGKKSVSPTGKKRQGSAASQKPDNEERKVDASNENENVLQPSQLSSRAFTEQEEHEEPVVRFLKLLF